MTAHLLFHQQEYNYEVHGIVRKNSINLPVLLKMSRLYKGSLHLHFGDVQDPIFMLNILEATKPDQVYNFAAASHVANSFYNPVTTYTVNTQPLWLIFQSIMTLEL